MVDRQLSIGTAVGRCVVTQMQVGGTVGDVNVVPVLKRIGRVLAVIDTAEAEVFRGTVNPLEVETLEVVAGVLRLRAGTAVPAGPAAFKVHYEFVDRSGVYKEGVFRAVRTNRFTGGRDLVPASR